jgi:dephospho-CoA kinase
MLVIGITGGVASGKSAVAQRFQRLGAKLLDADRCGHEVLREPAVEQQVRMRWGTEVFGENGRIDRRAVSRIVFGSSPQAAQELEFLEKLTHPRIANRLGQQIEDFRRQGVPAVVLDAAVMLKAGWHRFCDKLVFVFAPAELRRNRALARGWDADQFAAREAVQQSLEEKRRRSETVIDNSGSLQNTFSQVDQLWRAWNLTNEPT